MNVEQLKQYPSIEEVEVVALQMAKYVVKIRHQQQWLWLHDQNGENLVFNHVMAIKGHFSGIEVKSCYLVHELPYDEMIGLQSGNQSQMRLPLSLELPEGC